MPIVRMDTKETSTLRFVQHQERESHYREIGAALLSLEAISARVGIPILFPTHRVRALRRRYQPPFWDFVRREFVTVPTSLLESYYDDLEHNPLTAEADRQLFINLPSYLERWAFCITATIIMGLIFAAGGMYLFHPARFEIGLCGALLAFVLSYSLSTARSRRASFLWLVGAEIRRRQGLDKDGGERIGISFVQPT